MPDRYGPLDSRAASRHAPSRYRFQAGCGRNRTKRPETFSRHRSPSLLVCRAGERRRSVKCAARQEPQARSTSWSVVHGVASPPFKNKKLPTLLAGRQFEKLRAATTAPSPSVSSFSTAQPSPRLGAAALDSALIRRSLVTRWGLSTFPGSGISSCRRLT